MYRVVLSLWLVCTVVLALYAALLKHENSLLQENRQLCRQTVALQTRFVQRLTADIESCGQTLAYVSERLGLAKGLPFSPPVCANGPLDMPPMGGSPEKDDSSSY
jgi:hypothetical protein